MTRLGWWVLVPVVVGIGAAVVARSSGGGASGVLRPAPARAGRFAHVARTTFGTGRLPSRSDVGRAEPVEDVPERIPWTDEPTAVSTRDAAWTPLCNRTDLEAEGITFGAGQKQAWIVVDGVAPPFDRLIGDAHPPVTAAERLAPVGSSLEAVVFVARSAGDGRRAWRPPADAGAALVRAAARQLITGNAAIAERVAVGRLRLTLMTWHENGRIAIVRR